MTGSSSRQPPPRGPTLRTTLLVISAAVLLYTAVVGLVVVFRIGPAAARLQGRSESAITEYQMTRRRADRLDQVMADLWRQLGEGRRGGTSLPALEDHRHRLQELADSSGLLRQLAVPGEASPELRRILADAERHEARLRGAMLGAVAALEVGDLPAAEHLLRWADSLDAPLNDALAAATTIALTDVNRHQADLAGTARTTGQLVWGLLLAAGIGTAALMLFLRRRLYAPMAALDQGLARVAAGDLLVRLNPERHDELGRLTEHFNRMTEVLRQRATEEEQRLVARSAAQTRLILDAALDAVITMDTDGLIREWSPQAEAVFGWKREEVVGTELSACLIPPEFRAAHAAGLAHYRRTGEGKLLHRRLETIALRRDGSRIPVELAITPVRRPDGTVEFSAFVRDITERTRTQSALAASEARYRAAFEQAAFGMAEVAPDGRFLRVNRAFAEILGYAPEEVVGRSFAEVTHPADVPADRDAIRRLFAGEIDHVQREKRYLRKDGSIAWVNLASALVRDAGGQRAYAVAVVQDVTDRKRLEEELRHSQKMDAVGRLAGGIAHDFNNLLTGIIGYADLLQHSDGGGNEAREHAGSIAALAERGADLSRNLLTLARRNPTRAEAVDLHDVAREVTDLVYRTFDRRIQIRLDLAAPSAVVSGDRSQLTNALLNLALNARDAMPHGGRLTVATRASILDPEFCSLHAEHLTPGNFVSLSVRDTGTGMSPETQARIFEPFFTTKAPGAGTGLGLAMVYGTVRAHHGLILVESEPGAGSTFTIHLPASRDLAQGRDAAVQVGLRSGSGRILLADDEEMVRDVCARMLRRLGYDVDTASDGQEAVERVTGDARGYDLVILDGNMPRLTGPDACRLIRTARPDARILLASGYVAPEVEAEWRTAGFQGVIHKPYNLAALSQAVAQHLGATAES